MAQADKYFIGPGLREKLREVVGKVDALSVGTRGATQRTVHQDMPRGGGGGFRICTFTGAWAITTQKTVTFRGVTTAPNTIVATNLFASISTSVSQTRNCAIARDGTAWYLIAAEC